MGWFDGWFGGGNGGSNDPLSKLDPKVREFLERESPVKLKPSPGGEGTRHDAQTPSHGAETSSASAGTNTRSEDSQAGGVPPQSLYQDGRYAHLWKTYRPLSAVEAETKSDHEKLMDVLDGFKDRKVGIGKAALENCALEQLDWSRCMKSGDWTARMTMCRAEVRKFEHCYTSQSKLLKALGYLSTYDRRPEVDEEIQMRADTLYHRMLEQEAAIEAAKSEGREVPKFGPLIDRAEARRGAAAATAAADAREEDSFDMASLSPEAQKKWRERLEKLPEAERPAEEEAMRGEARAKAELASKIQGLWQEQERERQSRKVEGKDTILDKVANLFGR